MIVDSATGEVLVLRRADVEDGEAWQLPQGGIEPGESPRAALARELAEETGLGPADYEVADECDDWLAYELPEAYRSAKTGRGQVQRWFLLALRPGARVEPDGREFDASRWVALGELVSLAPPFRRPVYRRLVERAERNRAAAAR